MTSELRKQHFSGSSSNIHRMYNFREINLSLFYKLEGFVTLRSYSIKIIVVIKQYLARLFATCITNLRNQTGIGERAVVTESGQSLAAAGVVPFRCWNESERRKRQSQLWTKKRRKRSS